jgi:hypothetical protein
VHLANQLAPKISSENAKVHKILQGVLFKEGKRKESSGAQLMKPTQSTLMALQVNPLDATVQIRISEISVELHVFEKLLVEG